MKAPEKIYIHISQYWGLMANEHNITKDGIEYIRKDAFIEKAENYLKNQFIKDVSVLAGGAVSISFNTAISNFKKYMKGE